MPAQKEIFVVFLTLRRCSNIGSDKFRLIQGSIGSFAYWRIDRKHKNEPKKGLIKEVYSKKPRKARIKPKSKALISVKDDDKAAQN